MPTKEQVLKATQKHASKERKKLIIDFDEAIREDESEPIIVKFEGEEYELPSTAPAKVILMLNRFQDEKGIIDDAKNLELIEYLLGDELVEKILSSDSFISFELINNNILEPVMNHWKIEGFEDKSGKD